MSVYVTEAPEAGSEPSGEPAGCPDQAAAVPGNRREASPGEQEEDRAGGEAGEDHLTHGGQDTKPRD